MPDTAYFKEMQELQEKYAGQNRYQDWSGTGTSDVSERFIMARVCTRNIRLTL